jgi:hypothetical protein
MRAGDRGAVVREALGAAHRDVDQADLLETLYTIARNHGGAAAGHRREIHPVRRQPAAAANLVGAEQNVVDTCAFGARGGRQRHVFEVGARGCEDDPALRFELVGFPDSRPQRVKPLRVAPHRRPGELDRSREGFRRHVVGG